MTSGEPTWPPPPNLPPPLRGHDAFLTACIIETPTKMPLSRLRLVVLLQRKTGLDLRQCKAFVDYYCDRQAILMPVRGFRSWLPVILSLMNLAVIVAMQISWSILDRRHAAATTYWQRLAINHERVSLDYIFMELTLIFGSALVISILTLARQPRRNAAETAEAREKVRLRQSIVGILQGAVSSERQETAKQPGRD